MTAVCSVGGAAACRGGAGGGMAAWRTRGCCDVAAWKVLWRGGLAGGERENEMRRGRMK
uniref:Uncharacterized protein n=1 Tax=Fagus sylvatica TaxID=28930 RepID=A0A2N9EZ22_FAGSY